MKTIEQDFWLFWGESPEGTPKYRYGEATLHFIRRAMEKARQEERERIEKIIEDVIQEERFSGAPYALNKVKEIIRKK